MISFVINEMHKNTDPETGILIIHSWPIDHETDAGGRFLKCRMNWENDRDIIENVSLFYSSLMWLGDYYKTTGAEIGSRPEIDFSKAENEYEKEQLEQHLRYWSLCCEGYEQFEGDVEAFSKEAGKRLGREFNAYNTVICARRVCKCAALSAPDMVLAAERYDLGVAFALNAACESMEDTDIFTEPCKGDHIGCFDSSEINEIFDMIRSDRSLLPDPEVGYMLLLCDIFAERRPEVMLRIDELKEAADHVLSTLSAFEKNVLIKVYGLEDGIRRRHDELALEMHLPLSDIRCADVTAHRKLRHPGRNRWLRPFIEKV